MVTCPPPPLPTNLSDDVHLFYIHTTDNITLSVCIPYNKGWEVILNIDMSIEIATYIRKLSFSRLYIPVRQLCSKQSTKTYISVSW